MMDKTIHLLIDQLNKGLTFSVYMDVFSNAYRVSIINKKLNFKVGFMLDISVLALAKMPDEYIEYQLNAAIDKLNKESEDEKKNNG